MKINNLPATKEKRRALRRNTTGAERIVWDALRNRQLGYKFYRQFSVGPYILDFYCHELKIAVELDGGQHNEPDHIKHDERRTLFLKDRGIKVVRYWNNDVIENLEGLIEHLQEMLKNGNLPESK